ncbi:MAG: DASH family cryptochrome, partial [Verrucomicrobia bacterium]|nr:DASH family cryptochrome [Cytophagales bacterium]
MKKILVWFRNDLRLHDHEALAKAVAKADEVLPVFVFDPRHFAPTKLGFVKTGSSRTKFLLESVSDLRKSMQAIGGNLLIRVGKPEEIIAELADKQQITAVYASKEVTSEETMIEDVLEQKLWKSKIPLEFFWSSTLFHVDDIPFPIVNIPDIFTDFRKETEKTSKIREIFKTPTTLKISQNIDFGELPSLEDLGLEEAFFDDTRAVLDFKGGETEALQRLQSYIWDRDLLKNYKETRNGLLGADYSSKFSAWLAHGCLSPRKIYEEIKKYERQRVKNESTYWLVFELIWRDYFRFIAKKYGNKLFRLEGIRPDNQVKWLENKKFFEKWINGETGVPFVDANMRELLETGFMSNRGRQNVASFLTKDLKINWT